MTCAPHNRNFGSRLSREPFVEIHQYDDSHADFEIDTKKAEYMGVRYRDMHPKLKRRFENVLFLDNPAVRKRFIYR